MGFRIRRAAPSGYLSDSAIKISNSPWMNLLARQFTRRIRCFLICLLARSWHESTYAGSPVNLSGGTERRTRGPASSRPQLISTRERGRFPFHAYYIAVINGDVVVQRVKILEQFDGNYKVKSSGRLRVPELINPVPAGVVQTLPIEDVHDARRR